MEQDALIGTMLGNYRILGVLGQGGMARVYKAHQENLGRDVAVKVLPPWYAADRSFVERFNLEARLIARLSHPNIVTVHDANEQNGHLYIVMQLVDGGTLKHRLDQLQNQGKLIDMAETIPIFTQLADALTYAHEQAIIHRDIKPVNVLLDRSGRPILSDFGIAKVLASTPGHLTRPGAGVGTPEYMSPEQCRGDAVDGRADIYALGVMLFEALVGYTPFQGDNYPALAHKHIYEPPPYPSSINPLIHPAMERIILTALMKDPLQRYQSAREMAEALTQLQLVNVLTRGEQYGLRTMPPFIGSAPQVTAPPESPSMLRYRCPRCQSLNKAEMRFCTRCGFPLNQCMVCGKHNPVKNRFCIGCGQPLSH